MAGIGCGGVKSGGMTQEDSQPQAPDSASQQDGAEQLEHTLAHTDNSADIEAQEHSEQAVTERGEQAAVERGEQTGAQRALNWQPVKARESLTVAQEVSDDARTAGQDDLDISAESGLAKLDPLMVRPRTSSIVLCIVWAVLLLAGAAGTFWWAVLTPRGQVFEDGVFMNVASAMPAFLQARTGWPLASEPVVAAIAAVLVVISLIVVIVRKRWRLIVQIVIFCVCCTAAGIVLKQYLPRPYLAQVQSNINNSAPSGNVLLAIASGLVLVCAVPHAWRALCAVVSAVFTIGVGCTVMVNGWHRPVDVIMSVLIAAGFAMIMLAFTGRSGMDAPGKRVSSPSIQIVGTILITAGVCASAYGMYVLIQLQPGLDIGSAWTIRGSIDATNMLVIGITALANGLVLAMRQITASPMTRVGLLGAPPEPPAQH
ncbi:PAP2 family phosphoesterase [Bifidobacterium gallicum DSM 20093 = LMG 11596]|uniref:PAP2 family phosphoesterase n=2 Tax=Bifidobacterium gallicum DSM 20093 = LMG 11596 TaxID=561180 RepID=A0A087AE58_9BIFI|nr:PAP2 family phosphoesterase [Bifidobacterium gallicum DSM 20093 = LMG 11596]